MAALGEVTATVMGQAPPGKECNKDGIGTIFVKAGEFSSSYPIIREWTTKPLKLARKGDVLVCVVGATAGKVNRGIDCAIGRSVAAVRPINGSLDSDYLYYFLNGQTHRLRGGSQGVAQGVITRDMLDKLPIPLPPLAEQKRIAAILDQADALRRLRRQSIDRLNTLTQSIFYEMFGELISNERGWESYALAELMSRDPQNGLYRPSSDYGQGTRILRIDAFYDGYLLPEEDLKRVTTDQKTVEKYKLNDFDIVINRVNSRPYLGKSALVEKLSEDTLFESNMMRLSADQNRIAPRFLVDQLQSKFVKRQILSRARDAVNQSSINQNDVKAFTLRVPPLELQMRYVEFVTRRIQLSSKLAYSHEHIDQLFASLQQRAFRGEL